MTRFAKTLRLVTAAVPLLIASPSHAGFLLSGTFLDGATPQIQLDLKSDAELGTGFDVWVMNVALSPFSGALTLQSVESLLPVEYADNFLVLDNGGNPRFPGYELFDGKVIPQDDGLKGLLRWTFAAASNAGPFDFSAVLTISWSEAKDNFEAPPLEVRTQVFSVPEPSTWALLVWCLLGLEFVARRRRSAG